MFLSDRCTCNALLWAAAETSKKDLLIKKYWLRIPFRTEAVIRSLQSRLQNINLTLEMFYHHCGFKVSDSPNNAKQTKPIKATICVLEGKITVFVALQNSFGSPSERAKKTSEI